MIAFSGWSARVGKTRMAIALMVGCFLAANCSAQSVGLRLVNGEFDRENVPVIVEVPERLSQANHLRIVSGAQSLPVQWLDRSSRKAAFILSTKLQPGAAFEGKLEAASETPVEQMLVVADPTSKDLNVSSAGRPIMTYAVSVHQPPAGLQAFYARSGHIFPLYTPAGKVITSEFPRGHAHQHSLFNAWVNTTFEGHAVDFWNQQNRTGTVEHVRVLRTVNGPVFAEFQTELRHLDLTKPDNPKTVLQEFWTVRVWQHGDGHLFDIESRETCVADSPLRINQYIYGGMGFRANDQWMDQPEADFITSEGKTKKDGNHTRPTWTIAHGKVDNAPCYFAMMGYPTNFRHPEPVRLHPEMPYFVYSPPVIGAFELEPGKEHVARYRFFVADGEPDRDRVDRIWKDLSQPIKVNMSSGGP